MKKLSILAMSLFVLIGLTAQAANLYIESRDASGALTPTTLYEEVGTFYNSSVTSSAPSPDAGCGTGGAVLCAIGSRFTYTAGDTFTMKFGNHTSFTPGAYNIYITSPVAASITATGCSWVAADTAHSGGVANGTVDITSANTGNVWFQLASNVTLGAGATVQITTAIGTGGDPNDRCYATAVRLETYSSAPTPTASPSPTPWPTPQAMETSPTLIIDDCPSGEFNIDNGFVCDPIAVEGSRTSWYNLTNTGIDGDCWYRDNRMFGTTANDANTTAVWTFVDVPDGTYEVGYRIINTSSGWDNVYYGIVCASTGVDTMVVVSQHLTGRIWCSLKKNVHLSGKVVVTLYNCGKGDETVGSRIYADSIGLYAPPPPPAASVRTSWSLYR